MDNDDVRRRWIGGEAALGGLMVLLGLVVLLGQALDLKVGRVAWPVFVIVPGLGLLGLGLTAAGRVGEVLAMVGGLISVNGLVLGVQNATGRFDTWAYAWTLVLVVGPGIGRWIWRVERRQVRRQFRYGSNRRRQRCHVLAGGRPTAFAEPRLLTPWKHFERRTPPALRRPRA